MNKNRITKFVLIVSFLMILTLSACSNNGNNNNTNNGNNNNGGIDTSKNYDLIWWGLFENEEAMNQLIDKYEEQHSNVTISYVQRTEGLENGQLLSEYRDILEENLNDNEPLDTPDIVMIHNTWLGRYQPKLSFSTGTSATTAAEIQSDYFPVVTQDFVRKGNVYAVPLSMDALALIANTQLMAQISAADSAGPESTWFDLLDQSERLTQKNNTAINVSGFAAGLDNVQYLPEIVSLLMMQSNVVMTQEDQLSGFASTATFASNPESDSVLDFYRGFYSDRKVWDQTFQSEVASFLDEKLCMFIGTSWRLNDVLRLNTKYNLGLEPEVFKTPQINPDPNSQVYWADYWGMAVTRDSQDRQQSEVAWDFIKFLNEPAQLELYNSLILEQEDREIGIIYPRMSMATNQKSDQYLAPFIESLEKARTWDMIDGFLVRESFFEAYGQSGDPTSNTIQTDVNTNIIEKRTTLLTGP